MPAGGSDGKKKLVLSEVDSVLYWRTRSSSAARLGEGSDHAELQELKSLRAKLLGGLVQEKRTRHRSGAAV
jgi:hypothetical protein